MFMFNDMTGLRKGNRHFFSCMLVFLPENENHSLIRKLCPLLGLFIDLNFRTTGHISTKLGVKIMTVT